MKIVDREVLLYLYNVFEEINVLVKRRFFAILEEIARPVQIDRVAFLAKLEEHLELIQQKLEDFPLVEDIVRGKESVLLFRGKFQLHNAISSVICYVFFNSFSNIGVSYLQIDLFK